MSNIQGTLSKIGFDNRGFCITSEDESFVYIPIAKNASSFTEFILKHHFNWKENNFIANQYLKQKQLLVVIRDPFERWMSGVVEHFVRKNPPDCGVRLDNEHLLYYVFNQGALDEHTELQVNFLSGIDTKNCTFIRMNRNYTNSFKSFMLHRLNKKVVFWNRDYTAQYNESSNNPVKRILSSHLKKYYNTNKQARANVSTYLKPDYEFVAGLEFYDKIKSGI